MDLSTIIDVKNGKNPTIETYKELEHAYVFFNERLFDNQLPPCLITLQREKRTLGYHSPARFVNADGEKIDELALNPSYFGVRSIKQTLSTLVHEQAHAMMDVLGKHTRRGYHCREWGKIMKSVGLYPSNTGKYGGKETGQQMSHYIIKGGRFDVACDELLSNEFKLSWYDRYPPCSPMDLDIPLPSSFLVSTVAITPKRPKPICLDDLDDLDDDGVVTELGATRVDLILVTNPTNADADKSIPVDIGSDLDDGLLSVQKGKIISDDDDQIVIEVEDDQITISSDLLNKPSAENNSNRLKYKCPVCKVQVWGKPKLKLKCGEESCNDAILEVAE